MKKTIRTMIIATVCIMTWNSVPGRAEDTIHLAYNGDPEELAAWKLVHLVTEEMFRRMDIPMTYRVLPARRASEEANQGRMDGDNARIYAFNERFPNLLRVEETIYTQELVAYVKDPAIRLENWESLRDTDYTVEYLRGVVFIEKKLAGLVPSEQLSTIPTRQQGLKKLAAGRTDVFIGVEGLISSLLSQNEFKDAGIQPAGVLESTPLYLFMHKKHEALLPKLKEALIQIKTDGVYDEYCQQAFGTSD